MARSGGQWVALGCVAALMVVGGVAVKQALYSDEPPTDLTPVNAPPPAGSAPEVVGRSDDGTPRIDPAWVERVSAATGISVTAVNAYARAEVGAPDSCGLSWNTVAAIGWVESHHGTFEGRTLRRSGRSSSPIIGPALDGEGGFAAIPSTPETRSYHGDPEWDHAVGPMQFLPTTWQIWAMDGDGDGEMDPQDLDDAALAAAHFLCEGGRDLTTARGWTDAVLTYNRSDAYVAEVLATAHSYAV